jgi:hypothetical protein
MEGFKRTTERGIIYIMKVGRPSKYTEELALEICKRISAGESVKKICKDESMPSPETIYTWLLEPDKKIFSDQYARARATQAEIMFDEILEISDDSTNDWETRQFGKEKVKVENREATGRSRLRVDTRKWYLSKVLPKKFGEKLDLTSGGDKLPTPILNVSSNNSDEKDNSAD